MEPILKIQDLTIKIGEKAVVNDVSFGLYGGRTTALVGESGSGKTMISLAVMGLLPPGAPVVGGGIFFRGKNIGSMDKEEIRAYRGGKVGMVFQEPFSSLNPLMKAGDQVREALFAHGMMEVMSGDDQIGDIFRKVELDPDAAEKYPHELSGGMRQRVALAMAIACDPDVLILDEPTTALDVSVQKKILSLISGIRKDRGTAVLFITHDLSIARVLAFDICVMQRGVFVEKGPAQAILDSPEHPYTKKLIGCIPRLGDTRDRLPY